MGLERGRHLGILRSQAWLLRAVRVGENLQDALDPRSGGGMKRQLRRQRGLCGKENEGEEGQRPV